MFTTDFFFPVFYSFPPKNPKTFPNPR